MEEPAPIEQAETKADEEAGLSWEEPAEPTVSVDAEPAKEEPVAEEETLNVDVPPPPPLSP